MSNYETLLSWLCEFYVSCTNIKENCNSVLKWCCIFPFDTMMCNVQYISERKRLFTCTISLNSMTVFLKKKLFTGKYIFISKNQSNLSYFHTVIKCAMSDIFLKEKPAYTFISLQYNH